MLGIYSPQAMENYKSLEAWKYTSKMDGFKLLFTLKFWVQFYWNVMSDHLTEQQVLRTNHGLYLVYEEMYLVVIAIVWLGKFMLIYILNKNV